MRFSSVFSMPGPWSVTRNATYFPSTVAVSTVTRTSLPEYFTALSMRFETAAWTSSASPTMVTGWPGR
jgi:hypothetical protein